VARRSGGARLGATFAGVRGEFSDVVALSATALDDNAGRDVALALAGGGGGVLSRAGCLDGGGGTWRPSSGAGWTLPGGGGTGRSTLPGGRGSDGEDLAPPLTGVLVSRECPVGMRGLLGDRMAWGFLTDQLCCNTVASNTAGSEERAVQLQSAGRTLHCALANTALAEVHRA
jgi:hypothetical protein